MESLAAMRPAMTLHHVRLLRERKKGQVRVVDERTVGNGQEDRRIGCVGHDALEADERDIVGPEGPRPACQLRSGA